MPNNDNDKPGRKSNSILWISILIVIPVVLTCCCGISVGTYFFIYRAGNSLPGFSAAKLDNGNLENTRAWAEKTVARLKEIDGKGNKAATDAEVLKIETELKNSLLNKKVRWAFVVNGVRDQSDELEVDTFFGKDDGRFPKDDDPDRSGKARRRLYLRVIFAADGDAVLIGSDLPRAEALALRKGNRYTLQRTVVEVGIRQRDANWSSPDRWNDRVDVLDTFCIDIDLARRN